MSAIVAAKKPDWIAAAQALLPGGDDPEPLGMAGRRSRIGKVRTLAELVNTDPIWKARVKKFFSDRWSQTAKKRVQDQGWQEGFDLGDACQFWKDLTDEQRLQWRNLWAIELVRDGRTSCLDEYGGPITTEEQERARQILFRGVTVEDVGAFDLT